MTKEKKKEYSFTNGETTVTGESKIQKVTFGAMVVLAELGKMGCDLEEIHMIGKLLEVATCEEARELL